MTRGPYVGRGTLGIVTCILNVDRLARLEMATRQTYEPLAKTGNRPGFLCRKPQARDGQWAGRSV